MVGIARDRPKGRDARYTTARLFAARPERILRAMNERLKNAAKAAVRSIARNAARESGARNVRVNAVSRGPMETPIFGKMGMTPESLEELLRHATSRIPLGRIGAADEVASVAAFPAPRDPSFITGTELAVDGGLAQV